MERTLQKKTAIKEIRQNMVGTQRVSKGSDQQLVNYGPQTKLNSVLLVCE